MRYLPHTPEEITAMLEAAGLGTLDDLFQPIPEAARLGRPLALPDALDEPALMRHVEELAARNRGAAMLSFLGAGAYEHHFPPAADQLLLRSELYTAYTPYQPEVSQGTLQIIFEFQTIVSEILGLPVANASMYDASTALAEAVLMARRLTGRERTVIVEGVHPEHVATVETYVRSLGDGLATLVRVPLAADGGFDLAALGAAIGSDTACVVVGYPTFFGTVGDVRAVGQLAHAAGALLVTSTLDPHALALLASPGTLGADIAVAEGQPLGLPPQFGGPGVGLFACGNDRKYLQQVPGRLVGETVDKNGQRGYVLTLATREQHIRRERATSNICTNSGLCATAVTIRLCMLGRRGFTEVARQCVAKTEYLKAAIAGLPGYTLPFTTPTFHEIAVAVRGGDASLVVKELAERDGIVAGFDVGRVAPERGELLLVAVTERHSRADLDRLVDALSRFSARPAA